MTRSLADTNGYHNDEIEPEPETWLVVDSDGTTLFHSTDEDEAIDALERYEERGYQVVLEVVNEDKAAARKRYEQRVARIAAAPKLVLEPGVTIAEAHAKMLAALTAERLSDPLRQRTAYPEFCHHPDRCAGKGRCMSDWVCND